MKTFYKGGIVRNLLLVEHEFKYHTLTIDIVDEEMLRTQIEAVQFPGTYRISKSKSSSNNCHAQVISHITRFSSHIAQHVSFIFEAVSVA